MSQLLDYSIINTKIKHKSSFDEAMEQRAIKIKGIKHEHKVNCPKDCRYIKENVLIQLRICWGCNNQNYYKQHYEIPKTY